MDNKIFKPTKEGKEKARNRLEKKERVRGTDAEYYQELIDTYNQYNSINKYADALREIDNHIRSSRNPIPFIIETLKKTLPEYND